MKYKLISNPDKYDIVRNNFLKYLKINNYYLIRKNTYKIYQFSVHDLKNDDNLLVITKEELENHFISFREENLNNILNSIN